MMAPRFGVYCRSVYPFDFTEIGMTAKHWFILFTLILAMTAHPQPSPWQATLDTGLLAVREARYDEARQWLSEALREAETFPANDTRLNEVLVAQVTLYKAWQLTAGEVVFRDLIARWTTQWGADDPRVASALVALAALLRREPLMVEDDARVTPLYARAQQIREDAFGDMDPCLVETLEPLAAYAVLAGRDEEGMAAYNRAVAIKEEAAERDSELARLYYALADRHYAAKRDTEAIAAWEQALALYAAIEPEGERTAYTLNRLAWAYERCGDYPRMVTCWRRAVAIRARLAPDGWEHLQVLEALAQAERDVDNPDGAEAALTQAVEIRRRAFPGSEGVSLVTLADLNQHRGRYTDATALYHQVADPLLANEQAHPGQLLLRACLGLGECALATDDPNGAQPWLARVQAILDGSLAMAQDDELLLRLHVAHADYARAAEVTEALLARAAERYPAGHPRLATLAAQRDALRVRATNANLSLRP